MSVPSAAKWRLLFLGLAIAATGCRGPGSGPPPVKPLPDSAFRLEWKGTDMPTRMSHGDKVKVTVTIRNASDQTWRDSKTAAATEPSSAIFLSYRWLRLDGKDVSGYTTRFDLPRSVPHDQIVAVPVEIVAPGQPGEYQIQFDLVQEFVAWFELKGSPKLIVPVTVT
jgi:hypothetical protein